MRSYPEQPWIPARCVIFVEEAINPLHNPEIVENIANGLLTRDRLQTMLNRAAVTSEEIIKRIITQKA